MTILNVCIKNLRELRDDFLIGYGRTFVNICNNSNLKNRI